MSITLHYYNTVENIYIFTCGIILVSYISIWLKCLNCISGNISIIGYELPETQDYVGSKPALCSSEDRHPAAMITEMLYSVTSLHK